MTISVKSINTLAKATKTSIESNKTLPATVTVDGVKYTYGQVAYILAYAVNNLNKSADVFTVKGCDDPHGDVINENIYTSDYKDIAKRVAQYIKTHKQCPNYAMSVKSKKRIRARIFIYMFARIIVWYNNNNKVLPKYANANSEYFKKTATATKPKVEHKYLTNTGCSGMGQCTGYYCACNSLQQCFYKLTGILVPESSIASAAGTTTAGTDHLGINTAVAWFNKKYKQNIKITWKNFSDLGSSSAAKWTALQSYIDKGAVFCHLLYRNKYGHYEVPQKVSGDNVIILNSLGNKCNAPAYCGYIETRAKAEQLKYINGISQKSMAILSK